MSNRQDQDRFRHVETEVHLLCALKTAVSRNVGLIKFPLSLNLRGLPTLRIVFSSGELLVSSAQLRPKSSSHARIEEPLLLSVDQTCCSNGARRARNSSSR